jgi:hypothetical protein
MSCTLHSPSTGDQIEQILVAYWGDQTIDDGGHELALVLVDDESALAETRTLFDTAISKLQAKDDSVLHAVRRAGFDATSFSQGADIISKLREAMEANLRGLQMR